MKQLFYSVNQKWHKSQLSKSDPNQSWWINLDLSYFALQLDIALWSYMRFHVVLNSMWHIQITTEGIREQKHAAYL